MDQSFDPFSGADDDEIENVTVNFSDMFSASFDTSFENSSFQFPATSNFISQGAGMRWDQDFSFDEQSESIDGYDRYHVNGNNSFAAASAASAQQYQVKSVVHIALHEEMVCLHNSITRTSSCTLKGAIHLKSSTCLKNDVFFLVIKDPRKHIENLSLNGDPQYLNIVKMTNEMKVNQKFKEKDIVFKISVHSPTTETDTSPTRLLSYTCPKLVTPVPIVVQNKVRIESSLCRVAVQIRSIPSNENHLTNITILMAVPTTVNGDTVRMSREGGVWDSFKRLIVWSIADMAAGTTLTLQTLFEFTRPLDEVMVTEGRQSVNFPVLVRCSTTKGQLSNISVNAVNMDHISSSDLDTTLSRTFRVLYRKV